MKFVFRDQKKNRVAPDIRVDKIALAGGPYEFNPTLLDPDYGIPTKNIWILGSNLQTID